MSLQQESLHLKILKAKSLLSEVDTLMELRYYTTAINRLYYSCFHITKALLLTRNLTPKTHSGVISMLHQHFVQNGSFDMEQAAFFSSLMQERIDDDYSDFMIIEEQDVIQFISPAKVYVDYVDCLIQSCNSK